MGNRHTDGEDDCGYETERLLGRIWGYSQLGMHKKGIDECKKLIDLTPLDITAHIELALCYQENNDIEKAIEYYNLIIKKFPGDSTPYVNLGFIYEGRKNRNDLAIVCYEKAYALNPDDEWAMNNIGAILKKEGRWQDALAYYEKAYQASKVNGEDNDLILHNLAWAQYHCKNYDQAMELYRDLVNRDSDNPSLYADLGCVNYKMGEYQKALELFEKASGLRPDDRRFQRLYQIVRIKTD